jgi:hypothetical protein
MSPIAIPGGGLANTVFVQGASPLDPHPRQMARNGLYPNASQQQKLRAMANHIARYRTRQVACFAGPSPGWSDTDPPSRIRWRGAWHSSTFASQLRIVMTVFRQQFTGSFTPPANPGYVVVECGTVAGAFVGSLTCAGGAAPFVFPDDFLDGPENYFHRFGVLQDTAGLQGGFSAVLPTDTDLHFTVTEQNNTRIVSCAIYEETLPPDTTNGYIDPNIHVTSPITSQSRKDVADILRAMWRKGAAHLISWSRLLDSSGIYGPPSTASLVFKNLVDNSSTACDATTPGYTLDLSNCTRLSTASQGVRVFLAAFGKCTSGGNGEVQIRNLAGTKVVSVVGFGTSLGWMIGSGYLAAGVDKYDLRFATAAGTLTVEAVSVWMGDY